MSTRRSLVWTALAPLALALVSLPAGAFPNEPTGLGKARFGMGQEEVEKLFPGLQPVRPAGSPEASATETHQVSGRTVLGIPGCNARFHFANSIFYQLGFDCAPDAGLLDAMKQHFGPPDRELAGTVHWFGETATVSLDPRTGRGSYSHNELRAVSLAVMQLSGETPGPPGTASSDTPAPSETTDEPEAANENVFGLDLRQSLAALKTATAKEDIVRLLLDIALYAEPRTASRVAPYLDHSEFEVFEAAVSALESMGGPQAVRLLGGRLDSDFGKERKLLLVGALLELSYEEGAAEQLSKGLNDPDVEVRQETAMNLAMAGDRAIVPRLREAHAAEEDAVTKRFLARALELLGAPLAPGAGAGTPPPSERALAGPR